MTVKPMTPPPASGTAEAATRTMLAMIIIISCFYFFTGGGANQAAQFCLVRSIIEEGRIQIDTFSGITQDVSKFERHYYSNKAPGLPFFSVPIVAVVHSIANGLGLNTAGESALYWEARVATLFGSTLPTVAVVLMIFCLARRFGASSAGSTMSALLYGLGTTAWSSGTIFWSHALTASCLFSGYSLALLLTNPGSTDRLFRIAAFCGFCSGWAVLTEYHALGAAAIISGFALWNVNSQGWSHLRRVAAGIGAGASLPAALLLGYQYLAFGSPFQVSYQSTLTMDVHEEGFLGLTGPRPNVLMELLVGEYRGILPSAPILIVAIAGLVILGRDKRTRAAAVTAGAIFTYYLIFNSSLHFWAAGWTFGPRYLFPGVALLAVGLAPAWDLMDRSGRFLLSALGGASVFINLMAVSVQPFAPEGFRHPIRELYLPAFLDGRMSINNGPFYGDFSSKAFNLGEAIGLNGISSLLPLLGIWLVLILAWIHRVRPNEALASSKSPQETTNG